MKARAPFRVFVTGTDTGVGKTETSCALLSLLADEGLSPAPMKPYESGARRLGAPEDALALCAAARSDVPLELVCPHRFRAPLAPGVAARRLGVWPDFRRTLRAFHAHDGRTLVVEGAGGLFVPIDRRREVIDLIEALELPVLLVARAGLGTLNHTALSIEALRARGLEVLAVVLSRSSPAPDPSLRDNPTLIRERHHVKVLGPVRFEPDPARRRQAFRRALRPLIAERS